MAPLGLARMVPRLWPGTQRAGRGARRGSFLLWALTALSASCTPGDPSRAAARATSDQGEGPGRASEATGGGGGRDLDPLTPLPLAPEDAAHLDRLLGALVQLGDRMADGRTAECTGDDPAILAPLQAALAVLDTLGQYRGRLARPLSTGRPRAAEAWTLVGLHTEQLFPEGRRLVTLGRLRPVPPDDVRDAGMQLSTLGRRALAARRIMRDAAGPEAGTKPATTGDSRPTQRSVPAPRTAVGLQP